MRSIDAVALVFLALALASLEIALKEAPKRGWTAGFVLGLLALAVLSGVSFIRRSLASAQAVVDLRSFADRNFAVGCILSFVLGIGLFGSVYLMPVFLAFVRKHGPIEIGLIIVVTGIAQLITAPIAILLDRRYGARWLSAIGFTCFAVGLAMSTNQTIATDYNEMFWPQIVRGSFIALCILPPTRFALGLLPLDRVSDASGLYNLCRNLGGAIGIALIDTVMFTRGPEHADWLTDLIHSNPAEAARYLGLSIDEIPSADDAMGFISIMDAVQDASLTMAINEAWAMLAGITALAVVLLWVMGPIRSADAPGIQQPQGE